MWKYSLYAIVIVITTCLTSFGHAQSVTTQLPDRVSEVDEDDLILLNVAAKGRVVELLANELARTEIIRALLVEYARECAHNVSVLESHCIECMMERCSNRLLECGIELPPLSEVISHDPTPIKGLQFLSKPPEEVDSHLDRFIRIARPDVLQGVPKNLLGDAGKIYEEEVGQSLRDLVDNRDTDAALRKIHLHDQRPPPIDDETGPNGVVFVISHVDHGESVADILGRSLRRSRPKFEKLVENMPTIVDRLNTRMEDFRNTVSQVFSGMMDNYQETMNQPNTAVVNGNGQTFQPNTNKVFGNYNNVPQIPMSQNARFQGQGQFNPMQFNGQQFAGQQQFQPNVFNSGAMSRNQIPQIQPMPSGQPAGVQSQFNQQQNSINANPAFQDMAGIQPRPTPNQGQLFQDQGQGQMFQGQGQMSQGQGQSFQTLQPAIQQQGQWQSRVQGQGQTFNAPSQGQAVQGQNQNQNLPANAQTQGAQGQGRSQNFQTQSRSDARFQVQSQRRRKRDLVDCGDLKRDPETHCRKFEAQCYNCTLEKRLRFEVCGDGVERARDEIKRLDTSVDKYLDSYDKDVADTRLLLKIELNDRKRLHKSDSYNDAFITAKIGSSIVRFQSKMILNIKNIRVSGSQIGDELWEKLWEQQVFKEAEKVELPPKEDDIMGQTHILQHNTNKEQSAKHTSGGSANIFSAVTLACSVVLSAILYFI